MSLKDLLKLNVLALVFLAASASLQAGWTKAVAHKDGEQELPALPTIEFITKNKKDGIVLKVTNNTDVDLYYSGYRKDFPQLFYRTQSKDGKWLDDNWHWCGTGMSQYKLKKGESQTFRLGDRNGPSQVFTLFQADKNPAIPRTFSLVKIYSSGNK